MKLSSLPVACAGVASLALLAHPASAQTPRVAVFAENNFPVYGAGGYVSPYVIARRLKAAGLDADTLNTDTLSDPSRFNAQRYAAAVFLYGNTYPQEAFANLRRFHQGGGSLITTGIPFTHPAARVGAANWSANPNWGPSVRRVAGQGPTGGPAVQITGDPDRWTGITCGRFKVGAGQTVSATCRLRSLVSGKRAPVADPAKEGDNLYVRFFDADGQFIRQDGTLFAPETTDWQLLVAQVTAPANAAFADVSLQVRRRDSRYRAADFGASVAGKAIDLPNGDFARPDPGAWSDLGNSNTAARWGADGIGVGGFAGPKGNTPARVAPGDPLRISGIFTPVPTPRAAAQWVDTASLPKGVRVIPAIGTKERPLAALVVHEGDAFKGAVDAWTYRSVAPDRDLYENEQVILRATVAALSQKGTLSQAAQTGAFARLDALPRPAAWKNVQLPQVPRRYETFQPKMAAPARHLYTADVRSLSADEKLLLISLQGVVNRTQPRVYLVFDNDDRLWLDELQKQGATDAPVPVADPFTLLETFKSEYKGAVVCDPKIYDSPCVAVALAGADDLLIARTPELANRLKLTVKTDLRGKFQSNAEALAYVRENVMPRLDPYLSCTLDPRVYDKGGLDQIIAARGSTFWITGPKVADVPGNDQAAEMEEVRRWLAQMPLGAVVRGFWWDGDGMGMEEEAGVAMGSRFGKITLVSDLITNLSVQSGVKADTLKQKPRPAAPPLDPKKVYIAFTMSDGDNLCTWRGYFRRYFEDPIRGQVPVGWGMGPSLVDLAPTWAKWYYDKATPNDEFICDVSGVAYIYPPDWGLNLADRNAAMREFYGKTEQYLERMDMQTVRLMNVDAPSIAEVGTYLPKVPFLMPDYGVAGIDDYKGLTYTLPTGQPVFRAALNGSGPENFARQIRQRAGKARPAFLNGFVWNWGSNLSDLKKTLEILGPDYVAVLPSQLNELYRQAQKEQTNKTAQAK